MFGLVADVQVEPQSWRGTQVLDQQLRQFFDTRTGEQRQQGEPVTGVNATANRPIILRIDRRVENTAQIFAAECNPGLFIHIDNGAHIVRRVDFQEFVIDGGQKQRLENAYFATGRACALSGIQQMVAEVHNFAARNGCQRLSLDELCKGEQDVTVIRDGRFTTLGRFLP